MILISVPNPTHPNIFGWKFEDSQILDSGNYRPWHLKGSFEQNRKTEGATIVLWFHILPTDFRRLAQLNFQLKKLRGIQFKHNQHNPVISQGGDLNNGNEIETSVSQITASQVSKIVCCWHQSNNPWTFSSRTCSRFNFLGLAAFPYNTFCVVYKRCNV